MVVATLHACMNVSALEARVRLWLWCAGQYIRRVHVLYDTYQQIAQLRQKDPAKVVVKYLCVLLRLLLSEFLCSPCVVK